MICFSGVVDANLPVFSEKVKRLVVQGLEAKSFIVAVLLIERNPIHEDFSPGYDFDAVTISFKLDVRHFCIPILTDHPHAAQGIYWATHAAIN